MNPTVATKRCSTCGYLRPRSDFNFLTKSKDGRQPRCRPCAEEWYLENRAEHYANTRRRKLAYRVEILDRLARYFLEHPCVDCGMADVRVLEFDHRDPAGKTRAVNQIVHSGSPWRTIEVEIAKCDVRCANCHRIRTGAYFGSWRNLAEESRRAPIAAQTRERLTRILRAHAA